MAALAAEAGLCDEIPALGAKAQQSRQSEIDPAAEAERDELEADEAILAVEVLENGTLAQASEVGGELVELLPLPDVAGVVVALGTLDLNPEEDARRRPGEVLRRVAEAEQPVHRAVHLGVVVVALVLPRRGDEVVDEAIVRLVRGEGGADVVVELVAIDGRSIAGWEKLTVNPTVPHPQWRNGQQMVYTVERGAQTQHITVTLERYCGTK